MEEYEKGKRNIVAWTVGFIVLALIVLLIALVWGASGDLEGEREQDGPQNQENVGAPGESSAYYADALELKL